jgi:hypothetical protein
MDKGSKIRTGKIIHDSVWGTDYLSPHWNIGKKLSEDQQNDDFKP